MVTMQARDTIVIRIFVCCFICLLMIGSLSAQEPYAINPDVQQCINIRDDSNTDANIIACLSANTPVTVLSSRPYWREILFNQSDSGWIAKKFIIPTPLPPTEPVPDPLPDDMWMTFHYIDVEPTHIDPLDGEG